MNDRVSPIDDQVEAILYGSCIYVPCVSSDSRPKTAVNIQYEANGIGDLVCALEREQRVLLDY